MKCFSFFLFISLTVTSLAASSKAFQLRFVGKSPLAKSDKTIISRELDYKMINSKAFCPAHSFAKRVGSWSCDKKNGCRAKIKCHLITKSQNRKSSLDFLGEVSPAPKAYRIYVTKRPLVTLKKSPNETKKVKKVISKKAPKLTKEAPLVFGEGDDKLELFNDDALLEEGETDMSSGNVVSLDETNTPAMASNENNNNNFETEDNQGDEDDDESEADESEETSNTEIAESNEDNQDDVNPVSKKSGLQALHFSLQMVKATVDSSGEQDSLGPSIGLRWQPQYFFSKNFSLGADLAWNTFSLERPNTTYGLTVIGYGAFAKYFFGENFYGVLGYGIESWSSGEEELGFSSFSRISYGGGYRFTNKVAGFLDSVELVGASMTSDVEGINASHFKLSFNISFY